MCSCVWSSWGDLATLPASKEKVDRSPLNVMLCYVGGGGAYVIIEIPLYSVTKQFEICNICVLPNNLSRNCYSLGVSRNVEKRHQMTSHDIQ